MKDPCSSAKLSEAAVKHLSLDIQVDFTQSVIKGTAIWTVQVLSDTKFVSFDCKDLAIHSVSLPYILVEPHAVFGSELRVSIPVDSQSEGSSFHVTIEYSTSPASSAVQWLSPEQTMGSDPFMFTQCQAIHARTLVPCQDSPGAKFTYDAVVRTTQGLTALMSALRVEDSGSERFRFKQDVPIPSYLLALAVGRLEGRFFGKDNRCSIWAEPQTIEKAYWEFSEDTDHFLQIAEDICGPYVWKHYGVLVLPPSFPYGGMENPCLTFVTPTLLAGDRSLVNVVAHEISHSWMGNLVTNVSWEHFWLNEGFTVYLERRIAAHYHGENVRDLHGEIGWKALRGSVDHYGHDHEYTKLIPSLEGVDPDDAFSSVPYEKGFALLMKLESIVGGASQMELYLKAHCSKFQMSTVDSFSFKAFFLDFWKSNGSVEIFQRLEKFNWDNWFYAPGMPEKPQLDQTLIQDAVKAANMWISGSFSDAKKISTEKWQTAQKLVFLETIESLLDEKKVQNVHALLEEIDATFNFRSSQNAEVRFSLYSIMLKSDYEDIFSDVVGFVKEQGRMKFVRPLYRLLFNAKGGSDLARKTFQKHCNFYHSIAAKMIRKDLGL